MDKQAITAHFDSFARQRPAWFRRNLIYHEQILRVCRPFLNPTSRVLELGCSTGDLLHYLNPAQAVGVDLSAASIQIAAEQYPRYTWLVGDAESLPDDPALAEPFDLIIMTDLVGYLDDIQQTLHRLRRYTHPGSRVVISLWNWMWQPILRVGEGLGMKAPDIYFRQNWMSASAVKNLLMLTDFEVVIEAPGLLIPYDLPPISTSINAQASAPILNQLALVKTVVARPAPLPASPARSVTVVIPTRNERGNIAALVERTPEMGSHTELLFIDGNSTDGTVEEIQRQIALHPERDIKFMPQVPPHDPDSATPPNLMLKLGKGDAVRKAFAAASGEVLMILDSDISVLPEDMPKFYEALVSGKGRFINGTRFNYPQQEGAMKPVNMLGNVFFSLAFSWLLGQRLTDTLCGTKVLYKEDYERIAANRAYFGDFDPFGDFDLLFGAAWLRHKMIEVPIRYQARTYGESKVRVRLHGPLLGRMSLLALWQFKIRPVLTGKRQERVAEERTPEAELRRGRERRGWLLLAVIVLIYVRVVVWWMRRAKRR